MKPFTLKTFSRAIRVVFQSILLPLVLAVSGCGGGGSGGGGTSTTPPPPPPTAVTMNFFISNAPLNNAGDSYSRDAEFNKIGGLGVIRADEAYKRRYFGQDVTVAVVDSGLYAEHQEFSDRVVPGRNAISLNANTNDTNGHGTNMAGIIAAGRGRNGSTSNNMHGVAPQASIMPIKIFTGGENNISAADSSVIEAINWAYNRNAKIFNNSYSEENILVGRFKSEGGALSQLYRIEVPYAYGIHKESYGNLARRTAAAVRNKDMVMVFAAGNDGWQNETGMIEAEGLTCADLRTDRNCGGNTTDFSYGAVVSTFVSEGYINKDGNNVVGEGDLLDNGFGNVFYEDVSDGSGFPITYSYGFDGLSSYYSSMPIWALNGIGQFLQDAERNFRDFVRNQRNPNPAETARIALEDVRLDAIGESYERDPNYLALKLRWLSVVAVDESNTIEDYSNGCGYTSDWCLAAPGYAFTTERDTTGFGFTGNYDSTNGTSIAAAYVSGALAVLKSRLRSMPTYVASAVLLTTATNKFDSSFTGEVYGHGILNLSAAITYIDQIQVARSSTDSVAAASFNPQTSRIVLPAAMAGVKEQLGDAQVAFELPGGLYYNTPLSEFVDIQDAPKKSLGNAAADMLREETDGRVQSGMFFAGADSAGMLRYAGADVDGGAFGEWRVRRDFCDDCGNNAVWQEWQDAGDDVSAPASPFFAGGGQDRFLLQMRGEGFNGVQPFAAFGKSSPDGDSAYQQFGLRWSGSVSEGFSLLAEASQVVEDEHFMGADWRAFGAAQSRTWQGRFALSGEIATGWKSFLQFEAARGDVDVKDGGFLRGASGLRADGFLAGLERSDVLFGGDKLRLWAGQETALRSGKLHLRYPQAIGSFPSAFSGISKQTLQTTETDVELSAVNSSVLALGYAMRLSDDSAAAFAIEQRGDESAVSTQFRFRF